MDQSFTKTWRQDTYPFISPTRPELSAKGKNIVITGGGTTIGKAIAVAFAQAGAQSVTIIGRRLEKLQEAAPAISAAGKDTKVLTKSADILDLDLLTSTFKAIADEVGKIDVAILNAGSARVANVLQIDDKELREQFDQNVIGALNTLKAFTPVAAPEPTVFYTATGNGHTPPMPMLAIYTLTKAAGVYLLDHYAVENPNVHVVNVVPGFIPSDLNGHHPAAGDTRKSLSPI
jgi:NAD(P)-dependent dehydrogenase (short-subunit alcohol dehydrogenase family)